MNEISQGIEVELNRHTLQDLGYSISIEKNKYGEKIIKKIIKNGQELDSLYIPATYIYDGLKYKITKIGKNVFSNCEFLKEISLPDSVTEIEEKAFFECKFLTTIALPKNLIKIGKYAFSACESLKDIELPDSIIEIEENALEGCKSFQTIILPQNLTKLDKYVFSLCESLKEIKFSNNLTIIDEYAFEFCKSLEEIILSNSVTEIGEYAFSGCELLTTITFSQNLTKIGKYAFSGCKSLKEISIPNNIIQIKEHTFEWCKSLEKIEIPNSVTEIEEEAFEFCGSLQKVILPQNLKKIGKMAFFSCESLEIEIPNSFVEIGENAFLGCKSSKRRELINNNINKIDEEKRKDDSKTKKEKKNKIREVTLNDSVLESLGYKKINDSINDSTKVYYYEQEVTSLNIPEIYDNNGEKCKITKIGNYVFSNCKNLIEVKIPDSIIKIEDKAFLNCTNLKNINIPNSVKEIGRESFFCCNYLPPEIRKKILNKIDGKDIKIETNDKTNKKVRNCFIFLFISLMILFSLFFFTKGDNSKNIAGGCSSWIIISALYLIFYWWPNRCEVNNRTLKSLGYKNKFNITSINIPNVYAIENQGKCGKINHYKYKIIRIGDNAFKDCKNLKQITIPDSISEIGKNAFNGCTGLEKLIIPDSVFEIGENAFKDIENVIYHGNAIGSPWGAKNLNKE